MRVSSVFRGAVDGGFEIKLFRELPPAKFASGQSGISLAAVGSQRAAGIWFPGNGCPVAGSLMIANDVGKTPCFSAAVGTVPDNVCPLL